MPNNKFREVKHTSESPGPGRARAMAAGPWRESPDQPWQLSDRVRLRSAARKLKEIRKIEIDDVTIETFTLPLEAARLEVRAIIGDISKRGYQKIVERWRQLPDGQIEFTLRRLPAAE
ncbi:MAG: hypothetical protein WDN50_13215 [Bradyrhizobium sp.]